MNQGVPSSDGMANFRKIMKVVYETWQGHCCTLMSSIITRFQSKRAPSLSGGKGGLHHMRLENLQQLTDATLAKWTKLSQELF